MSSLLWCSVRLSKGTNTILDHFNDFPEILTNCEVIQLVDDTVIFVSAKDFDSIELIFNADLKNFSLYFVENELLTNLKASNSKCTPRKLLTIPKQLKLSDNHTQIYVAESYKYLGTIINLSLNLGLKFDETYKQLFTNESSYQLDNQLQSITV